MKKTNLIFACVIGSTLEFYDFCLFAAFTPILSKVFFPSSQEFLGTIFILSIYAVSFFMRPIGGLIFGAIGDKKGRKTALSLSIIGISIPTFIMACIPTYEQIGIIAPLLLTICRLAQGIFVGGEHNGAAIFLIEHLQKNEAGRASAYVLSSVNLGIFLAFLIGSFFSSPELPSWTWRLPFLLGSLIGFIGFYIRNKCTETIIFQNLSSTENNKVLLSFIWKKYKTSFLASIGIGGLVGTLGHTLAIYINVYLTNVVGLQLTNSMLLSAFGLLVCLVVGIGMGFLSDKIGGPYKIMILAGFCTLVSSPLIYWLLATGSMLSIIIALLVLGILTGSFNGPMHAYLNYLFPANIRCRGISLGYSIGMAVIGGLMPILSMALIKILTSNLAPSLYLMAASLIGLGSLYFSQNHKYP